MFANARSGLFCACLILVIKCSAGSWDFWPFNINKITTPTVNIIPENDDKFIWYKYSDVTKKQTYIDSINEFLDTYSRPSHVENIYNCNYYTPPPENKVCDFDRRSLGPCHELSNYGYDRSSPCVFFTLSQIPNWKPIALNASEIQQNSDPFLNIPDYLNQSINAVNEAERENVWLTCEGDTSADKEYIGPISFYPQRGFPIYYFPFNNIGGYQSPIVAVRFNRPTRGVVITVVCKLWAKNIQLDEKNGVGFVKFHLLLD